MIGLATLLFAVTLAQEPSVTLAEKYPIRGEPTTVTLVGAKIERLVFVYQPDAPIAKRFERGIPQGTTEIQWTPQRAGIVRIEMFAAGEERPVAHAEVSVAFPGVPGGGLVIALFAGMLLFGAAGFSLRGLLSEQ